MRTHPGNATAAITLALLLGTADPGQAQQQKLGARDLAQLMPANSLVYAEMNHPQMVQEFLPLLKNSALNDYAGFRDDLYRRLKLEVGGAEHHRGSDALALILTPELLDELGRIKGMAVAVTGVQEERAGLETSFVCAIDPGTSNLVPLIARGILTSSAGMKSVRTVEGVRLYQSFQLDKKVLQARNGIGEVERAANDYLREHKKLASLEDLVRSNDGKMPYLTGKKQPIDPWGKPYQFAVTADRATVWSDSPLGKLTLTSRPEKVGYEPEGPVLAVMPGLVVVGSDADVVADVIRRDRGKQVKAHAPVLTDLLEFQQFAGVRKQQQLFGFVNLAKVESMLQTNPALAALLDLKGLLGTDASKELAAAFWLDQSSPHLDLTLKLGAKTPGPLVQLLTARPIDPRVLHFVPDNTIVSMTVPLFKEPGGYDKVLATIRRAGEQLRIAGRDDYPAPPHVTPDGRRLVTATREGIHLWDVDAGKVLRTIPVASPHELVNLAISADGQQVITVARAASDKGERLLVVTVREAETGKQMHSGTMNYYPDLAVSADGKRLAGGDASGKLIVVATADPGKILYSLEPEPKIDGGVFSICFSPDGNQVAYSVHHGGIKVWTMQPRSHFHRIKTLGQPVATMSFSPDGKYLAAAGTPAASGDRREATPLAFVKVFDAVKGDEVAAIEPQTGTVTGLSCAPGGKRLLVATEARFPSRPNIPGGGSSIKLWDLDQKKDVLTLQGNAAATMAMTADGKRIVAASRTCRIQVWDASDGMELLGLSESSFDVQMRQIAAALARPENKELATSGRSATVAMTYSPEFGIVQGMLILEAKDQAAAKAVADMLPDLLGKGQKPQTEKFGKHTIHTLKLDRTLWQDPLGTVWQSGDIHYGREGNILVFGPSAELMARALQGGAAGTGFAALPDVARTLAQVKDVNGLLLCSGRNIIQGWLKSQELQLKEMKLPTGEKVGEGKPWPDMERDLLRLYPQQFKKIAADLYKTAEDLPAGSLTLTARTDRLTVTGGQPGLRTMIPRLIDALVEWDLSRPDLGRLNREK